MNRGKLKAFCFAILPPLLLSLLCMELHAAVFYVAPNGSDSNLGTSSSPWRTIQKAANSVSAGDAVIVKAGTYNERVTIGRSGTSGSMISFSASGIVNTYGFRLTGSYIDLEGFNISYRSGSSCWSDAAVYVDSTFCMVKNNSIKDHAGFGILLTNNAKNCTVQGNTIVRVWVNGIAIQGGSNNTIKGNDISDVRCKVAACSWNDANGIEFHGRYHTFTGNNVHDILFANNPGYSPHIDAFQTYADRGSNKPGGDHCTFERNVIDNLQQGLDGNAQAWGWMLEDDSYTVIKNNICMSYGGVNTGAGSSSNLTVANNTFIDDLTLNTSWWPTAVVLGGVATASVVNNIFYNQYYMPWYAQGTNTGITVDYNSSYRTSGSLSGTREPHDIWAQNPLFVDASAKKYALRSGSPLIDTGVIISGITDDFAGIPRPEGRGFDIGAYEFAAQRIRPKNFRASTK